MIHGRKAMALTLGFLEVLIWVTVVYTIGDIREASSGRAFASETPPSQQEMKRR